MTVNRGPYPAQNGANLKTANKKRTKDTSLKDVNGHRAHWIELFLGWYKDGMTGKEVFFPAKGYKWNQLKEYNKNLRAQQANLDWTDVRNQLHTNHKKLVRFIKARPRAQQSEQHLCKFEARPSC